MLDIIVLGQFLKDVRAMSSPRYIPDTYKARLDKAVEIYLQHAPKTRIIISGEDPADLAVSEARAGLNYLLAVYGSSIHAFERDLVLEEQAQNTPQNAYYTKLILLAGGGRTPIVISSDFHIPAVEKIFRFVYGHEFRPTFVGADSKFRPGDLATLSGVYEEYGKRFVRSLEEVGIKPGEHEKIFELIKWTGHLSG